MAPMAVRVDGWSITGISFVIMEPWQTKTMRTLVVIRNASIIKIKSLSSPVTWSPLMILQMCSNWRISWQMVHSLSLFKQATLAGVTTKVVSSHTEINVPLTGLTTLWPLSVVEWKLSHLTIRLPTCTRLSARKRSVERSARRVRRREERIEKFTAASNSWLKKDNSSLKLLIKNIG